MEHIIVDGCSTDETVDIVQAYAERFPHIRWISERDQGQSDAMNKGVMLARGEILGFLNADDYYEPNTLPRIILLFARLPNPSMVVANCNIWDEKGKLLSVSRPYRINLLNLLLERFTDSFPMNSSAYFYHASLHEKIGMYKAEEHFAMDLDFILRAVQDAVIEYHDEIWGNYRYLQQSKTYMDEKSGGNTRRVRNLVSAYRNELCFSLRVQYELAKNWQRVKYLFDRLHC